MYLRALTEYQESRASEHTLTPHAVNNIGILYKGQDKTEEAKHMYLKALAGYEKAWGPGTHINTQHSQITRKIRTTYSRETEL